MKRKADYHKVYLAGGCFWGLEAYLKRIPGVAETQVGYANGKTENPTYEEVCALGTGHVETVSVLYDRNVLSAELLFEAFFKVVDPVSINRQGNDKGLQYRSGIYYLEEEQKDLAKKAVENEQKKQDLPIVTEILPLENFYTAEEYHQAYLDKNPSGYCHISISDADEFIERIYSKPKEESLRNNLTSLQYEVTQNGGTERPFENEYNDNVESGIYVDVLTGEPLFTSKDKFPSSCGWPSFSKPMDSKTVTSHKDTKFNMVRTEVKSRAGGSHLGHVFEDGPSDRGGLRYCINSAALRFIPYGEMEEQGYAYLKNRLNP